MNIQVPSQTPENVEVVTGDSDAMIPASWLEVLVRKANVAMFVSREGEFVWVNEAAERMTGRGRSDLIRSRLPDLVHPDDRPLVAKSFRALKRTGEDQTVVCRLLQPDGSVTWVTGTIALGVAEDGELLFGTATDITQRITVETSLREHRDWLELAQRAGRSLAWEWRPKDDRFLVRGPVEEVFGISPQQLPRTGRELIQFIAPDDRQRVSEILAESARTGQPFSLEHRVRLQSGRAGWLMVSGQVLRNAQGTIDRIVGVSADITERKEAERERLYLATHDPLTDTLNRREFLARLEEVIEGPEDEATAGLCFVDLDNFKIVNDMEGHSAGDRLLSAIASVLRRNLAPGDHLGRLGGDEFGLLIRARTRAEVLERVQNVLDAVLSFRLTSEESVLRVGASIGVLLLEQGLTSAEEALEIADRACYRAKSEGGGRFHLYEPGEQALERRRSFTRLIRRLSSEPFGRSLALVGQLIVPLSSRSGLPMRELFIRVRDPDSKTLLLPGDLIALAERSALMVEIDLWVIETALQWLSEHRDGGTVLAVNLSGRSLKADGFRERVLEILERHGGVVSRLCFEIPEMAVLADSSPAAPFMEAAGQAGARFTLDGFGSSLSSFTLVRDLPFTFLKIGSALTGPARRDPISRRLLGTIREIADSLSVATIATAIDTGKALELVRELEMDYAQGNLLGRPELLSREEG